MKRFLAVILVVIMLTGALCLYGCGEKDTQPQAQAPAFFKAADSADGYATVYLPEDRGIKILQLTDPQMDLSWKYSVVGSDTDGSKTVMLIQKLVQSVKPDLVIITGDLVMTALKNNWNYMLKYAELFETLQVPWTFTFGNHDSETAYSYSEAMADYMQEFTLYTEVNATLQVSKPLTVQKMSEYKYCLISSDETCLDGYGNHFINIRKRDESLLYTLCMLDCLNEGTDIGGYAHNLSENQILWYESTIKSLSDTALGTDRGSSVIKSMVYTHVGLPEFYTAWKEAWNGGNPTENYFYGHHLDGNYTKYASENGFFNRALALGSTTAVFFGHHHDNDFSVSYKGIRLTFGQHSGISHNYRTVNIENSSGAWEGFDFSRIKQYGDQRGGTLATIAADGSFTIAPQYATEVISDYDDFRIDYAQVVEDIREAGVYYVIGWDD